MVAAPGPPQCSWPQVSLGGFPFKQESTQVSWFGHKENCELKT